MDKISSTTSNTIVSSTLQNKQEEAAMVASPPGREEAAAAVRNVKKAKQEPRPQEQLNCPRCQSTNTKFCYYNNYSVTQPRYLCKACRRYWTKGGTLRNVPVDGGCRRNNKQQNPSSAPSPSSSSSDSKKIMNSSTQQLLMMMMPPTAAATAPMPANVLPTTFMSAATGVGGFELPSSDHRSLPLAPLSLPPSPGTSFLVDLLPFLPAPSSFGEMMLQHGLHQQQWLPPSSQLLVDRRQQQLHQSIRSHSGSRRLVVAVLLVLGPCG